MGTFDLSFKFHNALLHGFQSGILLLQYLPHCSGALGCA